MPPPPLSCSLLCRGGGATRRGCTRPRAPTPGYSSGGADRVASKFIPVFARAAVGRSCGGSGPSCFTDVPWGVASSPGSTVSPTPSVDTVGSARAGTPLPPETLEKETLEKETLDKEKLSLASPFLRFGRLTIVADDEEEAQDEAGDGSAVCVCVSTAILSSAEAFERARDGTTPPSRSSLLLPLGLAAIGSETSTVAAARTAGELTPGMQLHQAGRAPVARAATCSLPSPLLKGSNPPSPSEPEDVAGEVSGGLEQASDAGGERPGMDSLSSAESADTREAFARVLSLRA